MNKVKTYKVMVYMGTDGWRWKMYPRTGGHTVDASTEGFASAFNARLNAVKSTGATFPINSNNGTVSRAV